MKKVIILASTLFLFSLSMTSCTEDFDEINTNPNTTDKPLSYGLFNGANKELMEVTRDGWASGRMTLPWVQYSAQRNYTEEDRYQYRLSTGDAYWNDLYSVAQDYKRVIELNTNPETAAQMAQYGANNNQIAAGRIMLSYVFSLLVDAYGDVPYYSYGNTNPNFQALKAKEAISTPKFATQQEIYEDILKELSEASDMITPGIVFSNGDKLFLDATGKSSSDKMKKFANSLRLRIATRVKGVIPSANAHITDAIADGVMTSNEHNVGVKYENNLTNPSPFFAEYIDRTDFAINKTFVDLLKGNKTVFSGILDPRLFKFAAPVGTLKSDILNATYDDATDPDKIQGMPYGLPSGVSGSQRASSSLFSKHVLRPDFTEMIMEYAEVEFLLSEYNGWSQANYEKGVRASMEKWGVSKDKIDLFINGDSSAIPAIPPILPAANQENVLTHKYIALFMQPQEAWAEYRRTGFPKTFLLHGETYNLNVPDKSGNTTYRFETLIPELKVTGGFPMRLYYPTRVKNVNGANCQEAINRMGADKMNTKLIWIP